MFEFIQKLFQADFMPHGHCYFWKPEILWMTVGGDALTAAAYFSIPLMLFYFAKTRQDLAHKHVFFLFGTFILLCGATHVLDIWTAWIPIYRFSAFVKLITGLVSLATGIVLYKSIPALLALPSNRQLEVSNALLSTQMAEREKAEVSLRRANDLLETRVKERTAQLFRANRELELEVETRKKAERDLMIKNYDLIRINGDLDNFVYCASHDLKTPVANMEGLLLALREELPEEEVTKPIVDRLEHAVKKINRTIQDLSDVSKIQRPASSSPLEEIFFGQVLGEVMEQVGPLAEENQVQVEFDFDGQPSVWFSRQNLQSIMQNLVSNAIKYRSPDRESWVRVTTENTEKFVILTVADNGIGIDLERNEKKIFSLFKRLHDHVDGSGVGLYIVKRIIDNYQGKIEVESKLNKGTAFRVFFNKNREAAFKQI